MDPLSIIASTLTLVVALNASVRFVQEYCDAPDQLAALNNEVSDTAAVLAEVRRALTQIHDNTELSSIDTSHLNLALRKVHSKLEELETALKSCTSPPSTSKKARVSRIGWIKAKPKIQRIQSEIRECRFNLSMALGTFTASSSIRIELYVREMILLTQKPAEVYQGRSGEAVRPSNYNVNALDNLGSQALAQMEKLQLGNESTEHSDVTMQSATQSSVNTHLTLEDEIAGQICTSREISSQPLAIRNTRDQNPVEDRSGQWTGIGIRVGPKGTSKCIRGCPCSCHIKQRRASPRVLESFLGSVFVGYSGLPLSRPSCNVASCLGQKESSTNFIYQFPRWFIISRMIQVKAKVTTLYGPEVSLRFHRLTDGRALVFHYATSGEVSKMRELFEQGLASPTDVRYDSGWTPLHYAVQNNQVEICKLLLQAGADPHMETEAPTTPVEYAGTKILSNGGNPDIIADLRELFFDSDFVDSSDFSDLHKIVLEIRPGSVEGELRKSTAMLDHIDTTGRSPLSWAAQRGDSTAVGLLLEHGADPNNKDKMSMTPLHYAAQAKTPACLQLLVKYHAKILQQNRGWTALHYASSYQDDLNYIRPLVARGIDIEERTYVGKTALSLAILYGHLSIADFLVKKGADVHTRDREGNTPLALSIAFRQVGSLNLLLQNGAAQRSLSDDGDNLLHLVAKFPDVETIMCLSRFNLGSVDIDSRNKDGSTAREILNQSNSDPKIARAFQTLVIKLTEMKDFNASQTPVDVDDDSWDSELTEDVFEDASE